MSKIRFNASTLKAISNKFDLEIILTLDVSGYGCPDLGSIPECTNLLHLDLSNNHISSLIGIEQLKNVRYLNASYNNISDLDYLKEHPTLEWLALQGNKIANINSINAISGNKVLKRLQLQEISREGQNPVCQIENYRETVLSVCFFIHYLDGVRRNNQLLEGEQASVNGGKDGTYNSKEFWLSKDPKMAMLSFSGNKSKFDKACNDVMAQLSALKKGLI